MGETSKSRLLFVDAFLMILSRVPLPQLKKNPENNKQKQIKKKHRAPLHFCVVALHAFLDFKSVESVSKRECFFPRSGRSLIMAFNAFCLRIKTIEYLNLSN